MTRDRLAALGVSAVLGLAVGVGAAYATTGNARGDASAAVAFAQAGSASGNNPTGNPGRAAGNGAAGDSAGVARTGSTGGGRAAPTSGTIERVDVSALAVRTATGVVQIPLEDATTIQKLARASRADVRAGDRVAARGEADAQGKITVHTLQILPTDATRVGAGGRAGRANPTGGEGIAKPGSVDGGAGRANIAGGNGPAEPGSAGVGAGRPPSGAVVGTVERVVGDQITVTAPAGSVTVTVPDTAEVQRMTSATRADLQPRQTVSVFTPPNGSAALITISDG